ncbi:MAG: VWA domain-containing protein [Anaerolineae bacterium]|nr:VWA domain-containing protein [Anaerolineae bacterium]
MMYGYSRKKKERGQALVLVAFSIITLIAFVGLGVDLGLIYVEKVRVQRAADAAALAAAAELPLEPAARLRALEYLSENSYDCGLEVSGTNIQCTDPDVHVYVDGVQNFEDDPEDPSPIRIEITTMTENNELNPPPNTASRIRVKVTHMVPMFFMKLLGIKEAPVVGIASAENIVNLDIVLVFDKSGSMEFDTLCYGCWIPTDEEYPEGDLQPLRWDAGPNDNPLHCQGSAVQKKRLNNINYVFTLIEAEEYSRITNTPRRYAQGYTYWVLQRNGRINAPQTGYLGDSGALGRDTQGAYIAHFPYRTGFDGEDGASGVPCVWADVSNGFICRRGTWIEQRSGPYDAPRVDYDFRTPSNADSGGNNTWYIWIRAQGGDPTSDPVTRAQAVFWGYDRRDQGPTLVGIGDPDQYTSDDGRWFKYNGADPGYWTWRRLLKGENGNLGNSIALSPDTDYTLHFWGGSAGYAIDQIIITNYSGDSRNFPNNLTRDNNRTGQACNPCDSRFGGYPGGPGYADPPNCNDPALPEASRYRYNDPIFDDEQPLASTAAAASRFLRRLDLAYDQIGLVRYSTKADPGIELLCLKSNGAGCTKNVVENTILSVLMNRQQTYANGSTNIPDGLEEAIKMLDSEPPHNGRPGAAHIIVLMTDGQPNTYDNLSNANKNCYSSDLYEPSDDRALECSMYMAARARDKGIIIYGITLGEGADRELMAAITKMTGGEHLHAETPEALDGIFEYLYNRLFLRLVE